MKLYLVVGSHNDYDEYDSILVAAMDEVDVHEFLATRLFPGINMETNDDNNQDVLIEEDGLTITLVGTAEPDVPRGLVIGSFNAG